MKTAPATPILRHLVLALILAAAGVFAIGSATAQSNQAELEPVTIRYLVPRWASSIDHRIERQVAFQSALDLFRARFPQVQLVEVVSSAGDYRVDIAQQLEGGTVDAVWVDHIWYGEFQAAGYFVDLLPHLSEAELGEFYPWTIEALRSVNDELGALWHNTDARIYFYDSSRVPTPPKTWSEVEALCAEVQAGSPGSFPIAYSLLDLSHLHGIFIELGGRHIDDEGRPVVFEGENREHMTRIVTWFKDMVDQGCIPRAATVWNEPDIMPQVFTGEILSFVANSNFHIRQLAPNLPADEFAHWRATVVPRPDEVEANRTWSGGWVVAAVDNGDEARARAAVEFVKHVTGFDAMRATTKAGGWNPVRSAIMDQDPYYAENRFAVATNEALETSSTLPLVPIVPIVNDEIRRAFTAVTSGEAELDEAFDRAHAVMQQEYQRLNR